MKLQASDKLTEIAQDLVLNEVIKDKLSLENNDQSHEAFKDSSRSEYPSQLESDDALKTNNLNNKQDDALYRLREARMAALKKRKDKLREYTALGHGQYKEITEDEFANQISKPIPTVCHFFSPNFPRCSILDQHLEKICINHVEAKFVKLDASKAPFFASMLKIRVLPTILYFAEGKLIHSSIGFSDFGGTDEFPTKNILKILLKHRIIERIKEDDTDDLSSGSEFDD